MEQRTDEWFAARCGNLTASVFSDVMTKTKTGYGASRKNLMARLIIERLTGLPVSIPTTAAMQWGTDTEPEAREEYEEHNEVLVVEEGYVPHPTIVGAGASPDGLVGEDGLLEIKCPNTATHLDFILSNAIPKKYQMQMQWQMACTGREWCDFLSYDPRLPAPLDYRCQRVERDDGLIRQMEEEAEIFLGELKSKIDFLEAIA